MLEERDLSAYKRHVTSQAKLTVVTSVDVLRRYDFRAIAASTLPRLKSGVELLPPHCRNTGRIALRLFECFLQVTRQAFDVDADSKESQRIVSEFLGALHSDRFCVRSDSARYTTGQAFLATLSTIQRDNLFPQNLERDMRSCGPPVGRVLTLSKEFSARQLDEDAVWAWQGWRCIDRDGYETWLPLLGVYYRLGRQFTERLYAICSTYVSSRSRTRVPCLPELCAFLATTRNFDDVESALSDPLSARRFLQDFLLFFVETKYAKGCGSRVETVVTVWNNQFVPFVREHLVPAGFISEPFGEIPRPQARRVTGAKTHIRKTRLGTEVKANLLTEVPLHVTDSEAMGLLFSQLRADFDSIVSWAKYEATSLWDRYERRKRLAETGTVRTKMRRQASTLPDVPWLISRANPDWLRNAAATFEHYGYGHQDQHLFYPRPLAETAQDLGLPTARALLPHAALLVAEHPAITTAFLDELRLFDKNGKRSGLIETDGATYLVGFKRRKGAADAQQEIALNETSLKIVNQVISLTDPLRTHLREKGNERWRRLFLTTFKGIGGTPQVQRFATQTSGLYAPQIAAGLSRVCGHNEEKSHSLARQFSLRSLRATRGVLIYLEKGSLDEFAKALGHKKYEPRLMEHYLPKPILAFFQNRWIRIFQTGIIVEAMKDSPFLLQASGLGSLAELDAFLTNHAIKTIPSHLMDASSSSRRKTMDEADTEVIFGVNESILTVLLSLEMAVSSSTRKVSGMAIYWSSVADHLTSLIRAGHRPDLKMYLSLAEKAASPTLMERLIYDNA